MAKIVEIAAAKRVRETLIALRAERLKTDGIKTMTEWHYEQVMLGNHKVSLSDPPNVDITLLIK